MKEYGTNIRIQEPVAGDRPAVYASYDKPTSLPQNMKVMSMQWLGPDHKPMGIYDKFEIGKEYTLNLRIGFEGGEEKGQVYSKNWEEFKVNGKSVTAWMLDVDFTDGHVWEMNHSYKVVDPSAVGTLSGTVKSYNSATDPVTVQMFRSGSSAAAYSTTANGNSASLYYFRRHSRHLHHDGVEEKSCHTGIYRDGWYGICGTERKNSSARRYQRRWKNINGGRS